MKGSHVVTMCGPVAETTLLAVLLLVVVLLPRSVAILSSALEILLTMNPPHPIREAFSFQFWGNRSSITIHLIGWFDFKILRRILEAKSQKEINISTKNAMQKGAYIKNSTCSCILTSMWTTKTICWLWILVRNMGEYVFSPGFKPFLCAIRRLFSTADLPNFW